MRKPVHSIRLLLSDINKFELDVFVHHEGIIKKPKKKKTFTRGAIIPLYKPTNRSSRTIDVMACIVE